LSVVEDVDRYRFIEPGPFQHGELEVTPEDIIANLPYRDKCVLWFDHHISNRLDYDFRGSWWVAPSAARVIFEYYDDGNLGEFEELVEITDRIDGATLTETEIRNPDGYILVSMTIDGKVIEDEPYWLKLVDLLRANDLNALMADEEVERRCREFQGINAEYGRVIKLYSEMRDNVLLTDFRNKWSGEQGNRFLAYTLFPECDIWIKVMNSTHNPDQTQISVAHSIFRRSATINVGELMKKYGGGGHKGAGGCRVLKSEADNLIAEIIETCRHS